MVIRQRTRAAAWWTEFFAAEGEGLTMRTAMLDELGFSPRLDEAWAAPELTSRAADTGPTIRTVTDVRFEAGTGRSCPADPGDGAEDIRRTAAART
ncbi:hypothetical protein [Aeromicrobium sp. UC242_57]|uniref:hypothetical protein n=1 Tax=Aeromicrobium sp. UC242_57 TaxID=3374624 RepID=UPI0037B09FEE